MQFNVIKNAKRNILFGVVNKIVLMICPFIERTVIKYAMGAQYLGLNSLFSSILTVLSLSELGFSSAVVYHMYKPIAEGDTKTVNALLRLYRRAYKIIGLCIVTIGLMLIPVLPKLIKNSYPEGLNLVGLYLIFLLNTALSYFMFSYMSSLIVVHQRDDLNSTINTVIKILLTGSQIAILLITHNYYLFAISMPVFTILNNLWIALVVKKYFPQYHCEGSVSSEKLAGIKRVVAGSFIQKACNVTRNSLDSICISTFLGLTMTAMYNNYYTILHSITVFLGVISVSFAGGVGNHVATKSSQENFSELRYIDFAYLTLSGWCATCLLCLLQPFMQIWMGKEMMFPISIVILFCVYFYLLKLGDMRAMYSVGRGLQWEHRWRSIIETIANLALNILLGKFFGVYGIISATIISLFLCNYIWGAQITFSNYFSRKCLKEYYLYQSKFTLVSLVSCALTYFLCSIVAGENLWLILVIRMILCCIIPACTYYLVYRHTEEFDYLKKKLLKRT